MINKKEWFKRNIITFIIGFSLSLVITVSATVILNSRQIRYKNDKSVEQEVNELYQKANELYGYHIGDEIKVNGIDFYVIADSSATQDYVVALKKDPLTVNEVNTYGGVGTENNHVNLNCEDPSADYCQKSGPGYGTDFGAMAYCSRGNYCNNSYDNSDVKYVVDNWSVDVFESDDIKIIDGYNARIPTRDEMLNNLDCGETQHCEDSKYNFVHTTYGYWLMTPSNNQNTYIVHFNPPWGNWVYVYGEITNRIYWTVRPVINVYKSAIQKTN